MSYHVEKQQNVDEGKNNSLSLGTEPFCRKHGRNRNQTRLFFFKSSPVDMLNNLRERGRERERERQREKH